MAYTTTHTAFLTATMAVTSGTLPSATSDGLDLSGADETIHFPVDSIRLRVAAASGNLSADTALAMISTDLGVTWDPFPAANLGIAGGGATEALGDLKINDPHGRLAYYSAAQDCTFEIQGIPRRT